MADTPFVPGQMQEGDVPPQQDTVGLADQWRSWIANPQNRAGMIQFGLALSQPISAGQNIGGHIGQAFGQAGEASDRVSDRQLKEEELASKQELRTAQGEAATQRASAAETRASAARQGADFALERIKTSRENAGLRARVQLTTQYHQYLTNLRRLNQNRSLMGDPPVPEPSFDDWIAVNPSLNDALGGGGGGSDQGRVRVNSPEEAQSLEPGTKYITNDGKKYTR